MTDKGFQMCPYCGESIIAGAIKCRHCKAAISKEDRFIKQALTVDNPNHVDEGRSLLQAEIPHSKDASGAKPLNNNVIFSLLLGVFGLISNSIPVVALAFSGVGLYLGVKGLRSLQRGLATVGVVICSIGLSIILISSVANSTLNSPTSSDTVQVNTSGTGQTNNTGSSSTSTGVSSYDPADYDKDGNYKPVSSMTQEEIEDELIEMLEDRIYESDNSADYDKDGNYKPVSTMTQQEIEDELITMFEDNFLED